MFFGGCGDTGLFKLLGWFVLDVEFVAFVGVVVASFDGNFGSSSCFWKKKKQNIKIKTNKWHGKWSQKGRTTIVV
jgi:hypothetical protein